MTLQEIIFRSEFYFYVTSQGFLGLGLMLRMGGTGFVMALLISQKTRLQRYARS